MINYTYEGLAGYVRGTEADVLKYSNKKEFRAFEWESISKENGFGLRTKIRMLDVKDGKVTPTTDWNIG